jgi:lysophospholipase L1-like esterase
MRHRTPLLTCGMILGLLAVLATPPSAAAAGRIYISLGTSLAVGIQPDQNGVNHLTDDGYADQLHRILQVADRRLQLVKLGCPAETSDSMITGAGSICQYPAGSQLDQAVTFLRASSGAVKLITIDMGANDLLPCGVPGAPPTCVLDVIASLGPNLAHILTELRFAAGPHVPIVAMNYYNPTLAAWLQPGGQALAIQSAALLELFNGALESMYDAFGVPVADVAGAFHSDDFRIVPVFGLPLNVLLICQWTWMCAPPPVGPNIHANRTGYFVIALTFAATLRQLER